VLGHADGICAIFVDSTADPKLACRVVVDAKTDYPVACNAAETLLLHADTLPTLWPDLATALLGAGVSLRCDAASRAALQAALPNSDAVHDSTEKDYKTEFGDLTLAVKVVPSVAKAVAHINSHSSHHTDAILSRDPAAIRFFTQFVDSAGVRSHPPLALTIHPIRQGLPPSAHARLYPSPPVSSITSQNTLYPAPLCRPK
jgi:glutamate-5-semialdehyde dehydrogenase